MATTFPRQKSVIAYNDAEAVFRLLALGKTETREILQFDFSADEVHWVSAMTVGKPQ